MKNHLPIIGDEGSIPESERPPGEGNGNPLQDSCLENSVDRGAWWITVCGVAKSRTQLSDLECTHTHTSSITGEKKTFYNLTLETHVMISILTA